MLSFEEWKTQTGLPANLMSKSEPPFSHRIANKIKAPKTSLHLHFKTTLDFTLNDALPNRYSALDQTEAFSVSYFS